RSTSGATKDHSPNQLGGPAPRPRGRPRPCVPGMSGRMRKGAGMPRKRPTPPPTTPPAPPAPRVIHPDAVFTLDELRQVLGLKRATLKREARAGRLKVSRRCGLLWTTGGWVHSWLADGLVVRPKRDAGSRNGPAAHDYRI